MIGRVRVLSERVMISGKEPLVKSVMEKVVVRVREQPGFIHGDILRDTASPSLYCVFTEWESYLHLSKWLEHPEYSQFKQEMDGLLGKPTHYQIFHRHKEEVFLL